MKFILLYCVGLLICTVSFAQEKTSLNGFKWEATNSEDNVVYGVGISSPGLPFKVAEKQAQKMAEIWIESAVSTTINSLRFTSYSEGAQQYGFNFSEMFSRSIQLKSSTFDVKSDVVKTIQFEDGSVCVILKAAISSRPLLVNEQYVTINYSDEETTEGDVSNYSMSYSVLFQNEDLYLKAEQSNEKVSLYPARSIAKINQTKASEDYVPSWYSNPQKDTESYLYSTGSQAFSTVGKDNPPVLDAIHLAYIKAYFELSSKIQTKVEVLEKMFSEDLGVQEKESSEDPFTQPNRFKTEQMKLEFTSISRLEIYSNTVFIELRLNNSKSKEELNKQLMQDKELYRKFKESQKAKENEDKN
jgi:hypothetical protein